MVKQWIDIGSALLGSSISQLQKKRNNSALDTGKLDSSTPNDNNPPSDGSTTHIAHYSEVV